ncbi:unnamed protein product [Merluccius merluccius]
MLAGWFVCCSLALGFSALDHRVVVARGELGVSGGTRRAADLLFRGDQEEPRDGGGDLDPSSDGGGESGMMDPFQQISTGEATPDPPHTGETGRSSGRSGRSSERSSRRSRSTVERRHAEVFERIPVEATSLVETAQGGSSSRSQSRRSGGDMGSRDMGSRDTGSRDTGSRDMGSRLAEPHLETSTFALAGDSAHNQAMVHWSGHNSSASDKLLLAASAALQKHDVDYGFY